MELEHARHPLEPPAHLHSRSSGPNNHATGPAGCEGPNGGGPGLAEPWGWFLRMLLGPPIDRTDRQLGQATDITVWLRGSAWDRDGPHLHVAYLLDSFGQISPMVFIAPCLEPPLLYVLSISTLNPHDL